MNLQEWNERVFAEVVERVGRPGDPLYFYVDEDVLAVASGGLFAPEEAVQDFMQAFNARSAAYRFESAGMLVGVWQQDGSPGIPPFIHLLTMSVLGVTLPHMGKSTQNVYARQNDLLGLPIDGGCPPGYDIAMPIVWKAWNRWLDNSGSSYGTPTATCTPARPYQGWPRSQSFVRSVDKEDVLDCFAGLPNDPDLDPAEMLLTLVRWLEDQPRPNNRLLARVRDQTYADEFRAFLSSAWKSYVDDTSIVRRVVEVPGLVMWDQDDDRFDLVVDTRSAPPLAGEVAQLLDGDTVTISRDDRFVFLYAQEVPPDRWFSDPLHGWALTSRVAVQRDPRSAYAFGFVPGYGWVEQTDVVAGPVRFLASGSALEQLAEAGAAGAPQASSIPGWSWVVVDDVAGTDQRAIRQLVGLREFEVERRKLRIVGGLPMGAGQVFLDQGEPDVVVDPSVDLDQVLVNGKDVSNLLEVIQADEQTPEETWRLRLADLFLGPGDVFVEVRDSSGRTYRKTIRIVEPTRERGLQLSEGLASSHPTARGNVGLSGADDSSLSLSTRVGAIALIVGERGEVWTVAPSRLGRWASEARLEDLARDPLLEVSDIRPPAGPERGPFYLVHGRRSAHGLRWQVHRLEQHPAPATSREPARDTLTQDAISEFVSASPDAIIDAAGRASHIKRALIERRWGDRAAVVQRSVPRLAPAEMTPRADIANGPSDKNPFNVVLDWLSEREGGNVSLRRSAESFAWAWDRAGLPGRANQRYFQDAMRALGHVEVDHATQRLWVSPTVLSRLPLAASIRVLAGARPIRLIEALTDGETEQSVSREVDEFLAEMLLDVRTQRFDEIPYAPDTYYLRLEVEESRILEGVRNLGIRPICAVAEETLKNEVALNARWAHSNPIEQLPGMRYWRWAAIPHATEQRGRWRPLVALPVEGDHFIKALIGRKTYYGWYQASSGALRDIGWEFGRWMYERGRGGEHLLLYRGDASQLLLSASMPIPIGVRQALVSLTGLLPRLMRVQGVQIAHPRRPTHDYWVFENVNRTIAGRIRAIVGQPERTYADTFVPDKERNPIN